MDNANQTGSQQPVSGGVDVAGVEAAMNPTPVSVVPKKETEPTLVTEHIKSSEPELNIHPEITGMVEKTAEYPVLTQEHHEAGLRLSEPKPVIIAEQKPQSVGTLPMTESQALHVVKTGKVDSTKSWFANLVLKVIEKVKKQNELSSRSV